MAKLTKEVKKEAKFAGSKPGSFHTVKQFMDGSFWCSCPSFKFQRVPVEERACKHTRAFLATQFSA